MNKLKRTEWFPVSTPPERVGVYERIFGNGGRVWFQHWSGRWWGFFCGKPEDALRAKGAKSECQHGKWRGLAEDPNKKP